jgi:hypothetical protein
MVRCCIGWTNVWSVSYRFQKEVGNSASRVTCYELHEWDVTARRAERLFLSLSSRPSLTSSCLAGIGRAGVILTTLLRLMPTVRHCVTCLQSTHLGDAVIKYAQGLLLRVVTDFRCFPFVRTDVHVSLLRHFVDTLRNTWRSCLFLQFSWLCNLQTLTLFGLRRRRQ